MFGRGERVFPFDPGELRIRADLSCSESHSKFRVPSLVNVSLILQVNFSRVCSDSQKKAAACEKLWT